MRDFGRFPLWVVLSVIWLLDVNLVVVAFRLARVLSHFGIVLPFRDVSKESIPGSSISG